MSKELPLLHLALDEAVARCPLPEWPDVSLVLGTQEGQVAIEIQLQNQDCKRVRWAKSDQDGMFNFTVAPQALVDDLEAAKRFIGERWPEALTSTEWGVVIWMA